MKGIVYIINGCGNECYVGSTIRLLKQRMSGHKSKYNKWKMTGKNYCSSFFLFLKYGYDNCIVNILEEVEVENKKQLRQIENNYIIKHKPINKRKSFLSADEAFNYNKLNFNKWKTNNKEKNEAYQKEYQKVYRLKQKELKNKLSYIVEDAITIPAEQTTHL